MRADRQFELGEKKRDPIWTLIYYGAFGLLITVAPAVALGGLGLLTENVFPFHYLFVALIMLATAAHIGMLRRLRTAARPFFFGPATLFFDLFSAILWAYLLGGGKGMMASWLITMLGARAWLGVLALRKPVKE